MMCFGVGFGSCIARRDGSRKWNRQAVLKSLQSVYPACAASLVAVTASCDGGWRAHVVPGPVSVAVSESGDGVRRGRRDRRESYCAL